MEAIPYDAPTDLVALSVETYTARRAYQIASEYRRRGVPVVMGGFHATLRPDEVASYAEAVVVGEAEEIWPRLLDDFRAGRLRREYRAAARPDISRTLPDRRLFRGKRYLPVALVEAGRGCTFRCEFCAIQSAFGATQTRRGVETIVREIAGMPDRRAALLLRRRQRGGPPARGQGALPGARSRSASAGSSQATRHHGPGRGAARADAAQRLPGGADRPGEPRRAQPGRHEQGLQRRPAAAGPGGAAAARPRPAGLRHLRLRLRPRHAGELRGGARLRAGASGSSWWPSTT